MRIQTKKGSLNRYVRPQGKDFQRSTMLADEKRSSRPGSAVVARRSGSAVPEVKPAHLVEMEKFKNLRLKDVAYTIEQDFVKYHMEEMKAQKKYEEAQMRRMEKSEQEAIAEITDKML